MKLRVVLSSLTALFFSITAIAEGVSIDPGEWEMTSTITMSMMPQPQTTTVKECIKESQLRPEDFNMDEDNPCDIADVAIEGDTASWSVSCPSEGGFVMEGNWEFTSGGDTISGSGSMAAEIASQPMKFDMSWTGKRIGDCE
jgi:hypothetical protein